MARPKKTADQSATVSVSLRIDPRIKYGIDLAARIHKRTVTGVVEWAVTKALEDIQLPTSIFFEEEDPSAPTSLASHLDDLLWSSDAAVRFIQLASRYPALLSYDEMRTWETIKISPPFWRRLPRVATDCTPWENARLDMLSKHWSLIDDIVSSRHEISPISYSDIGHHAGSDQIHAAIAELDLKLEKLLSQNPDIYSQIKELEFAKNELLNNLARMHFEEEEWSWEQPS